MPKSPIKLQTDGACDIVILQIIPPQCATQYHILCNTYTVISQHQTWPAPVGGWSRILVQSVFYEPKLGFLQFPTFHTPGTVSDIGLGFV